MERVKMIWDFRGPNAANIARHHSKHLAEYIVMEGIEDAFSNFETVSEYHSMAYLVAPSNLALLLREKLKPHRGQRYSET